MHCMSQGVGTDPAHEVVGALLPRLEGDAAPVLLGLPHVLGHEAVVVVVLALHHHHVVRRALPLEGHGLI